MYAPSFQGKFSGVFLYISYPIFLSIFSELEGQITASFQITTEANITAFVQNETTTSETPIVKNSDALASKLSQKKQGKETIRTTIFSSGSNYLWILLLRTPGPLPLWTYNLVVATCHISPLL